LPISVCGAVYRQIDINVYQNSAGSMTTTRLPRDFRAGKNISADYHQQYLAKNPDGYCGKGDCGAPFKLAELQVGEKA
jgi:peptide methionine sulfoxide reductase MsrA